MRSYDEVVVRLARHVLNAYFGGSNHPTFGTANSYDVVGFIYGKTARKVGADVDEVYEALKAAHYAKQARKTA